MTALIQRNFAKGELDPALHSRVTGEAYATGLKTDVNFQVMKTGSLENRPGLEYVSELKDSTREGVFLDFDFGNDDSYILEFGERYMRVHRYGVQQREAAKEIEAVTQADPGVVTITAHGWDLGDEIYGDDEIGGMVELRKRSVKVVPLTADTFSLLDMAGNDIDTSAYGAFTSGGTFARTYEIGTPYAELHLADLSYAQSFDVLKLTHNQYAPANLTRLGHVDWTFADMSFVPEISAPTNLAVSGSTGTARYYVVTANRKETGEESFVSNTDTANTAPTSSAPRTLTWDANTNARTYNVYAHEGAGLFGLVAIVGTNTWVDIGYTPDYSKTPPVTRVSIDGLDDALTKLDAVTAFPKTALAGTGGAVAWHPDGDMVAVGFNTADYIRIYLYQSGVFTEISAIFGAPATLPAGPVMSLDWSPDGNWLAVAVDHATAANRLVVYLRNGLTLKKQTSVGNPATYPTGRPNSLMWSNNSNFLAVAHDTTPFISVYYRSGASFTKLANPLTLPSGDGNSVSFIRDAAGYDLIFVVGHDYVASRSLSPYMVVGYSVGAGASLAYMPTPSLGISGGFVAAEQPAFNVYSTAFTPAGGTLSVGFDGGDYLANFERIGNFFRLLADPDFLPTAAPLEMAWDPTGKLLAVAVASPDNLMIYAKTGGSVIFMDIVDTDLAGDGTGVSWSPDGLLLGATHATTPFAAMYELGRVFPGVVGFYQQRFLLGSSVPEPARGWASQIGNFKNFNQKSPITDDQGLSFSPAGWKFNEIRHFLDLGRLICLTHSGEYILKGDANGALTPFAVNPQQQSQNGCSKVRPVVVDDSAVYVERSGGFIRDLFYQFESDGYRGSDLTDTARHLFIGKQVVSIAYQARPHSIVWVVFDDGTAAGVTYNKSQQVIGWHRLETEGTFLWNRCVQESGRDVVYFLVQRTIGGRDVKYLERLTDRESLDMRSLVFVDSAVTYDGRNADENFTVSLDTVVVGPDSFTRMTSNQDLFEAEDVGVVFFVEVPLVGRVRFEVDTVNSTTEAYVTQLTYVESSVVYLPMEATSDWGRGVNRVNGLWHLEGENVAIQADEGVVSNPNNGDYPTVAVGDGEAALGGYFEVVHVGLPYTCDLETLDIDPAQTWGGRKMLVKKVAIRTKSTLGLYVGGQVPTGDDLTEGLKPLKLRRTEPYGIPTQPFTGVVKVNIMPRWNSNGRVLVRQLDPLPATILSVAPIGEFPNA